MRHVLALVLLTAVLFVGSAGWGGLATDIGRRGRSTRADRRAGADADAGIGFPLQVAVGAAVFVALGGVLVALDIAWIGLLVLWHAVGCGLCAVRVRRRARSAPERVPVYRRPLVWVMGLAGAAGAVMALGNVFGASYNPNDDVPAYMYLAQRLVSTGGLIDPFNLRRIGGYGASTLYQAMFLRISGPASLEGFEFALGAVVTLVLVVGTTRRRWLLLGTVLAGLSLLVVHSFASNLSPYASPLPVINLSPEFSATALTLASLQLCTQLGSGGLRTRWRVPVLLGVVLGALFALRFTLVPAAAVAAAVAVAALTPRRGLRTAAVVSATAAVASAGWAVASWRSSGTPLVAVVSGNYDPGYLPAHDPRLHTLGAYVHRFWVVFRFNDLGWVLVACGALAAVLWVRSARLRARAIVLFGAALGCVIQLMVLTYEFNGGFLPDVARFEAPSVLACALYTFWALWPNRTPAGTDGGAPQPALRRRRPPMTRVVRWRAAGVVVVVASCGLLWALTFGQDIGYQTAVIRRDWSSGVSLLDRSAPVEDPYPPEVRLAYSRFNALVPRGATVLAAVDEPALLDFSRYRFATVDQPGAVSPPPHLPLFDGAGAVLRYLRRLGYGYLAVDSPAGVGLYNLEQWRESIDSPVWTNKEYGRYFVQWQRVVDALEHDPALHSSHAQWLTLIDLRTTV